MTAPKISIYAAPTSGASNAGANELVAVDSTTENGRVVGAICTTNVYEKPDSDSSALYRVLKNQIVRALEECDGFYKVAIGDGYGWVRKEDCVADGDLLNWIVSNPDWYVRTIVATKESTAYDWISGNKFMTVSKGSSFQLKSEEDDYFVGIYTKLSDTGEEINTLINVPKKDFKVSYQISVAKFDEYKGATMNFADSLELTDYACSFVGSPYVWGGTDPATGVDCSGFVKYVYSKFGYNLPRCSWQQTTVGKSVEFNDLQPGDLIFYQRGSRIGHVAIYVGDGQCVHARSRSYGVCITPYDYSEPACAMRILGEVEK